MNPKAYVVFFCRTPCNRENGMWKLDAQSLPRQLTPAFLAGVLPATDPEELGPAYFK